jgi:dipeptidyl aminopeptidase/acylaminoacyl peptidase
MNAIDRSLGCPGGLVLGGIVFSLLVSPLSASAHPAAFSINDVMQAPYPTDLTVGPAGKSVAWVFDAKGVRNIWVLDRAATKSRQITVFTQDDGFDIGALAWSPDAKQIAFTRGGSIEDERPTNVTSSPDGPSPREVWVVSTAGGTAHKVGTGHSASFSPDGSRLVYIDKQRIWTAAAAGESAAQSLIVDQGNISSVTWSPDGKRLAFGSNRGSHAIVGVYDFGANKIAWMSPSLDRDTSATFSPRGDRIAFIRVVSEKNPEIVSQRVALPWSIWIADAASGVGRRVWIADNGPGSAFRASLSPKNLFWTLHDQLVFPWEKTGWLQLYSVPLNGGAPRAVTAGNFEVAHLALSEDRRRLAFSSGQNDTDRLHVWSVDPDGGKPLRAAEDRTIEDYPQVGADGTIFALQSGAVTPLQPVMLAGGGRWQPLASEAIPAAFPTAKLVTPETVTFPAKDGQLVHAQIFLPRDSGASTPHPTIMFYHGGPQRQMLLGFHPMGAYNWMYALNQYFVSEGYIVLSINYRGGIGYGLDYREAKDFGPNGGSELNDLLGAVSYLQGRKDVDSHRLGIWGGSYGGLMTALGLARASDAIAAGVDYAGLYNWATFLADVGAPIDSAEATARAVQSSPIATIDQWHSPVLLVQADDDRNVPSQQASELLEALNSHHIEHEVIVIPNEIHDLARYSSWIALFDAADRYFEHHLEKRGAP